MAELDAAQQDAWAYLDVILRNYDLGSLSGWAKEQIIAGNSPDMIVQLLWERQEFRTRYAAIFDRREAGLSAISVEEVLAYERQGREMMQQAGLPPGFYDSPQDFRQYLAKGKSLAELSEQIQLARVAVYQSPPEVRLALNRIYGIGEGDLVAHWIDPSAALPNLQRKMLAAQNAAAADLAGFTGALTQQEAEQLAELGITMDKAVEGFGDLVRGQELFSQLPGEMGQNVDRTGQLAAQFGGDATIQQTIEATRARRLAEFKGGGSFATDREGLAGLGSAVS